MYNIGIFFRILLEFNEHKNKIEKTFKELNNEKENLIIQNQDQQKLIKQFQTEINEKNEKIQNLKKQLENNHPFKKENNLEHKITEKYISLKEMKIFYQREIADLKSTIEFVI